MPDAVPDKKQTVTDRSLDEQSIAELFRELFERSPGERQSIYAARHTPDHVRDEVEALLAQPSHRAFTEQHLGTAGRRLAHGAGITWQPGTRIGDYEIVREIARGGMGVVYEANQLSLGRLVAIKVVRGAQFTSPSDARRFRAEAEAIARLEHIGIVPVHEVAEHDGLQFYSMGYFPKGSLKDHDVPLSPIAAAELVAQICDAIHYAHTQDIVHRDLKPANVLLTDALQPRVTDFGVAKDLANEADDLTHTGAILGTPGFMAPEQAAGDHKAAGHLTDIYGLGGILFYALTGKAPIAGRTLAECLHHLATEDPRDVRHHEPSVPADLASICRKSLERDPAHRYGSASAMASDLRRFLHGEPTEARPLRTGQRLARWCRRRKPLAIAAALAVVGMVGGATLSLIYAFEANDKTRQLAEANRSLQRSNRELQAAKADAEAFSTYLLDDIVRTARTADLGGINTDVTLRDALTASTPRIAHRFAGRPLSEAKARHEIGVTLQHVGEHQAALEQLRLAHAIYERELGTDSSETIACTLSMGNALRAAGQPARSIETLEALRDHVGDRSDEQRHQVFESLALSYAQANRIDDSHDLLQRMLARATGVPRLRILSLLSWMQAMRNERQDARDTLATIKASRYQRRELPLPDLEFVEHHMLRSYIRLEDDEEASSLGLGLLYRARNLHGQTDPITINVARRLWNLGSIRLPPRVAMEALETLVRRHKGDDCARNRRQSENCARMALKAGYPKRAHVHAAWVHGVWHASDPEHAKTFVTEGLLCEALIGMKRTADARTRLQASIGPLRKLANEACDPHSKHADQADAYQRAILHFEELLARL